MTNILTDDEKASIIYSHQKNLSYNLYNLQVSLLEENAKTSPDLDAQNKLNAQINELGGQIAALEAELAKLTLTSTAPII